MATRSEQLAQKRRDLQLRCALERQHVAYLSANIEDRLRMTDRIISTVSGITKHPLAIIGSIGAAMIFGPWRILKWASQGMMWFKVAKKIQKRVSE